MDEKKLSYLSSARQSSYQVSNEDLSDELSYEDLSVNEKDPWKYPLDPATGLRLVTYCEGEVENPKNWSTTKKWIITIGLGLICFMVAFNSAVVTGDMGGIVKAFDVSMEVSILTVTLFVVGFAVGPLVFAPLSEEWGRKIIFNSTLLVAVIFIIPCAVAQNIGTLLVCRLIDGIAFSAPMTVIGGCLADMWTHDQRGLAMAVFSAAPFMGPVVGPLVGGFIGDFASTWRWLFYVMLIFSGCCYLVCLVIPETHTPTRLRKRAKQLRKLTGDDRYKCKQDIQMVPLQAMLKTSLTKPFILLQEPIVFLFTLFMSYVYGLLYMFFFAYPVVFGEGKNWPDYKVGLAFIPLLIGILIGSACCPFVNTDYNERARHYIERGELPPPELRLIPMLIACPFLPIGLFIFAWTSFPHVSWWGPCVAGVPCGFAFIAIYNAGNNYIVDAYQHSAASALAAKTFVRSIWGACAVLFTIQMYNRLGYEWAGTLLAFLSLACCVIPFIFFKFGASVRKKSKYAFSVEKMHE